MNTLELPPPVEAVLSRGVELTPLMAGNSRHFEIDRPERITPELGSELEKHGDVLGETADYLLGMLATGGCDGFHIAAAMINGGLVIAACFTHEDHNNPEGEETYE
jgi:hypothetical protein